MNKLTPKEELAQKQPIIDRILSASLDELKDWALETFHSEENQRRIHNPNQKKFIIYIGRTVYAKLLDFTPQEFFTDAEKSFAAQLKEKLFIHHVLEEDTPFNLNVGVDLGTALEATLFGMDFVIPTTADPTYANGTFLQELEDYKKLEMPDFYKSGWMPEAHRLYNELQGLSGGAFDIYFPGWARGPWSMATILRGFNNIFEDEVDGNLFSAQMNREIIIPAQKKLSDYYHGISYYHSCGSLVSLYDDIATLNVRKYQHISPATFPAYEKIDRLLAPEVIAQISLKPTDVATMEDPAEIRRMLESKTGHLNGRKAEICADALFEGGWELIEKVMNWRNLFRELEQTH